MPFSDSIVIGVVTSSAPIAPDTYPIGESDVRSVDGGVVALSGAVSLKTELGDKAALVGEIALTRVDEAGVAGTFTANLADGGTLSGTFDAPMCDGLL
ncbi:MAG: hypothetical protein WBV82_23355 [Myxococcaceae bacterium]